MEVNTQELIQVLSDKITLYQHLGIEVVSLSSSGVHFKIDLEKNKNHKGTAFGGSLYATAVLAAYAFVLVCLREAGLNTENIVIAKGEIKYLRPVTTDFSVRCGFDAEADTKKFLADLKQNTSARLTVQSHIFGLDNICKATFSGEFVAKL